MSITLHNIDISKRVFDTSENFEPLALELFQSQYDGNEIYRQFCDAIKTDLQKIKSIAQIPFLPIQFFKTKKVTTGNFDNGLLFESSGTTGSINSKHFVKDKSIYEASFRNAFRLFYGNPGDHCIIGLLPSYLERQHSSLVYMVNDLVEKSNDPNSGFYLYDTEKLHRTLLGNEKNHRPTLLIGVTYALLDFAEKYNMKLKHTIIMETGGMKGRREELTRQQVHEILKQRLGVGEVHSEYGMTELLSQAYAKREGIFNCPPWMKIILRAEDDPFEIIASTGIKKDFATGVINIIDLANIYSCSFIATDDMGKLYKDGSFEVLGRVDNSDIRGCGLMIL